MHKQACNDIITRMKLKKKLRAIRLPSIAAFPDMAALRGVFKKSLIGWIPLGVAITGLSGLTYLATQQNIRLSANDPQIQISEDITSAIEKGVSPGSILPPTPSGDMTKDLGPFVIIYKDSGEVLGSSTQLDSSTPKLPDGVLEYVAKNGEERFTWEPKKGVRSAAVVRKYAGGFVLVGKSLREVEKRENLILSQTALAWALIMALSLASKVILAGFEAKKR